MATNFRRLFFPLFLLALIVPGTLSATAAARGTGTEQPPAPLAAMRQELLYEIGATTPATPAQDDAIARLMEATDGRARISLHQATGNVRFVRLPAGSLLLRAADSAPESQASAFFREYAGLFGIRDAGRELALTDRATDRYGFTTLSYAQRYEGVEVFAGVLKAHFDGSGALVAINGTFVPGINADTQPRLDTRAAERIAEREVAGLVGLRLGAPVDFAARGSELLLFRTNLVRGSAGTTHLAYRVEVANGATVREWVFVDAHKGTVLDRISGIHNDLRRELSEPIPNSNPLAFELVWEEGDALPTGNTDWNNILYSTEDSYNLFGSLSGGAYLSYDGADHTMASINNDPRISCPNANWNGSTTNYCNDVSGDDTVAHEWTHAYTEYTSGLIYQWQSGALNESYSDIFGEAVDFLNAYGTDSPDTLRTDGSCSVYGSGPAEDDSYRWLSGEDDPAFGGAIRDLWTPTCYGDPGKVSDQDFYICSTADSGGVHTNSGVPNHGYALMVDGGSYNGQTITGIGLTKATHLHWRAMSMYLTPSSNFSDHADALEQSCADLTGQPLPELSTEDPTGSTLSVEVITPADCADVASVIAAVEFRDEPAFCEFGPLLNPDPLPLCATEGGVDQAVWSEDFEAGLAGWTLTNQGVYAGWPDYDWSAESSLPAGRAGTAAFGIDPDAGNCDAGAGDVSGVMRMESETITIPAGNGDETPLLAWQHYIATEVGWDGGNLKLSVNGGAYQVVPASAFVFNDYPITLQSAGSGNSNPLAGQPGFSGTNGGTVQGSWGQSQVDLSQVGVQPGDTIRLRYDMGIDGCTGIEGWYVDDIEVVTCLPGTDPQIDTSADTEPLAATVNTDEVATDTLQIRNEGAQSGLLVWELSEAERSAAGRAPHGGSIVADGSFEATNPNTYQNPFWPSGSDNFGVPFCDATCGGPAPRTGDWYIWFGGTPSTETAFANQDVTLPNGEVLFLSFYLMGGANGGTGNMSVSLDGNIELFTVTDEEVGAYNNYRRVEVDLSPYADGATHNLAFTFVSSGGTLNFFVDDVAIDVVPVGSCTDYNVVSWLSVAPDAGQTVRQQTSEVTVTYDGSGLSEGTYTASLCLDSNDPTNPQLQLPVTLTVTGATAVTLGELGPAGGGWQFPYALLVAATLLLGVGALGLLRRTR